MQPAGLSKEKRGRDDASPLFPIFYVLLYYLMSASQMWGFFRHCVLKRKSQHILPSNLMKSMHFIAVLEQNRGEQLKR